MKTTLKVLIAGAVTAMAATFATGAFAASLLDLHEQHKAQILGFLFGGQQPNVAVTVGPAYQAPPVYSAPAYGNYGNRHDRHYGHRDSRAFERRDGYRNDRHDGRGYR